MRGKADRNGDRLAGRMSVVLDMSGGHWPTVHAFGKLAQQLFMILCLIMAYSHEIDQQSYRILASINSVYVTTDIYVCDFYAERIHGYYAYYIIMHLKV